MEWLSGVSVFPVIWNGFSGGYFPEKDSYLYHGQDTDRVVTLKAMCAADIWMEITRGMCGISPMVARTDSPHP